jgi:hypothetical protein
VHDAVRDRLGALAVGERPDRPGLVVALDEVELRARRAGVDD